MRYRLHLVCPVCDRQSIMTSCNQNPRVDCGDCLADRVEIVEMTVVKVEELEDE